MLLDDLTGWRADLQSALGKGLFASWFACAVVNEDTNAIHIGLWGPWAVDYFRRTLMKRVRQVADVHKPGVSIDIYFDERAKKMFAERSAKARASSRSPSHWNDS